MNAPVRRNDGYMNVLSGLNTPGLDRSVMGMNGTRSGWRGNLERYWNNRSNYMNYAEIYYTDGLAQRIIDKPSDDAFKEGLEVEGDDSGTMEDEFDRLAVYTKMADAVRWARLYGGAAILMIVKDGSSDLTEPLNMNALEQVLELRIYDMTCVKNSGRYYADESDPGTFGKLEVYTITPPNLNSFDVHETRLITVSGAPVPMGYVNYNGIPWTGRPVLEGCMADLMRYNQSLEWALRLLERKQQAVYQMNGLGEMFANGDDAIVQQRINLVDLVRGNLNSIVIDKDDVYQVQNLGMDGVQQAIQEYQSALCASSGIASIVLFGQTKGGLHSSGNNNMETYYGVVAHIQNVVAQPAIEKLIATLYVQKTIKKSDIPDEWHIKWCPLWSPTELEKAQSDQAEATADQLNINNLVTLMNQGIMSAEEVRKVVVNDIYGDYDLDDALPSDGGDINYAQGIDTAMLQVAAKKNVGATKGTLTVEKPNAQPAPKAP